MAKEQLAVIEMVTNMILGKTGGISKVVLYLRKYGARNHRVLCMRIRGRPSQETLRKARGFIRSI